jgi:sec-independent protein translocase protein TatB
VLFDIGLGELIVLAAIGLVVVGPERLPQYAAKSARFLRQLRGQVTDVKESVKDVIDIDPEMVRDLQDLNPKRILQDMPDDLDRHRPGGTRGRSKKQTPLDPDTT